MIFKKKLESTGGKLLKEDILPIYLFASSEADDIVEVKNGEDLFRLFTQWNGAVVFTESAECRSPVSDVLNELERRRREGRSHILWGPAIDEKIFQIEFLHVDASFTHSVDEVIVQDFELISDNDGAVIARKNSFGLELTKIYLSTEYDDYPAEVFVDIEAGAKGKAALRVRSHFPETAFKGGVQYFHQNGPQLVSRFYSGLFDDSRDDNEHQSLDFSVEIDPVIKETEGVRIYLNPNESTVVNSLLISSRMKRLKLKSMKKSGDQEHFYFLRTNTLLFNQVVAPGFVPFGDLEVAEEIETDLLLNSGTSKIELRPGDILRFGLTDHRRLIGELGGEKCLASTITVIPNEKDEGIRTFSQAGQNKVYYDYATNTPFLPKVANAAHVAFVLLPYLSKDNYQFEQEVLEDFRYDTLSKAKSFLFDQAKVHEVRTSKGIKAKFAGNRLMSYTFAKEHETKSIFSVEFDGNNKWAKMVDALEKDDIFLAFAPAMLGQVRGEGIFRFSNWEFDFLNNGFQPLLLIKYSNISFEAALQPDGIKHWTNHHIKTLFEEDEERDFLQEQWRQRGAKVMAGLASEHRDVFCQPSWKGIMVMDIPLDERSVPPILRPFIPKAGFKASYLAFGTVADDQGENPAKCYAAIDYKNPSQSLDRTKEFDYKLIYINALFTGSKIVRMECLIKLGMKTLLDEEGEFRVFDIKGKYSAKNDAYVFEIIGKAEFEFESLVHKIIFDGATLTYDGQEEKTKLDLKGALEFDLDFDPQIDFKSYLPEKIAFERFGFDFKSTNNVYSLIPDFARTKFKVLLPSLSGDSFLSSFPLRFNSFHYKTAKGLGFYEIFGKGHIGDSIGFVFDLDLGTLGAAAKKKNLRSQLYIGWFHDGSKPGLSVGFKFQGFSTSLKFNLFDVIGMEINDLTICQYTDENGKSRFIIKIVKCWFNLLGQSFGELNGAILTDITESKDIAWLLILENNNNRYLKYLSLGQRAGLSDSQLAEGNLKTVDEVAERIKSNLISLNCSDENVSDDLFNKNLNWLIGGNVALDGFFDLKFVFLDPRLYAMRLQVAKILKLDAVYNKINDNVGVWHAKLELPDHLRNWNFGAVDVTFSNVEFDCFTNGGFKFDFGFPRIGAYQSDYSDSGVAQLAIFTGKGGFYFSNTKSVDAYCGDLRALEYGLAIRVGLGREICKGPLRAGASITVYGLLVGTGCFASGKLLPDLFRIRGRIGVILEIYGRVDFGIISAGVQVWIEVFSTLTLSMPASNAVISAGGNIFIHATIRIKIGFIKITKSFSFRTRIEYTFTVNSSKRAIPKIITQKEWKKALQIQAKREKLQLEVVYLPDLSIRENNSGKPVARVYHSVALLTESYIDNGEIRYRKEIPLSNATVPGNPLKAIVDRFVCIEDSLPHSRVPDNFPFHNEFKWRLMPLTTAFKSNDVSRIQLPIVPGMHIDGQLLEAEVTDGLREAIQFQYINSYVRSMVIEDHTPLPYPLNKDLFLKTWLDNFFAFVYAKAKEINEDLGAFKEADYYQLEGAIYYFLESGLRLPHPSSLWNSIPARQIYSGATSDLDIANTFTLEIEGQTSSTIVEEADLQALNEAYAKENAYLKDLLGRVERSEEYQLKEAEFAVNMCEARSIKGEFYYPFPESILTDEVKAELLVTDEREVARENDPKPISLNYLSATNIKLFGNIVPEVDKRILLFEIKGSNSEDSKALRQMVQSDIKFESLSLQMHSAEGTASSQMDFVIYRNNLSRATRPPLDTKRIEGKVSENGLIGAARFSENPKLFIEILRDATLTNNGGYFIEPQGEAYEVFRLQKVEIRAFELLILCSEHNVKKNFHNIFRISDSSTILEKNQLLFFANVRIKDSQISHKHSQIYDYVPRMPADAIGFRLECESSLLDKADYSLREDFSLLEYSLKCGDFELKADRTIAIPNSAEDRSKIRYMHSSPILANFDGKGKPIDRNPYSQIGNSVQLAFNWRNGQGERLFNQSVLTKKTFEKKYTDQLIPVREWPDFKIHTSFKDNKLNLKFCFNFQELVTNWLVAKSLLKLRIDHPNDGPVDGPIHEIQKLKADHLKALNQELKAHYLGAEASDENGGMIAGVLQDLQRVQHQIEDLLTRKSQGATIRLLLNEKVVGTDDFDQKMVELVGEYVDFIRSSPLFDSQQIDITTYYRIQEENGGSNIKYHFEQHEVDLHVRTFEREITINKEIFGNLTKDQPFQPIRLYIELLRPSELVLNEALPRDNPMAERLNPFRAVRQTVTHLSIPTDVLFQMNKAWGREVCFGKGLDPYLGRIVSWAINRQVLDMQIRLDQEKGDKKAVEHLFKPILNKRWTGIYALQVRNESIPISFAEIDMDVALNNVLSAYETFLQPAYYHLFKELGLDRLNQLIQRKEELAKHLPKAYLYRRELNSKDSRPTSHNCIVQELTAHLQENLNNYYLLDGAALFKTKGTISGVEEHRLFVDLAKKESTRADMVVKPGKIRSGELVMVTDMKGRFGEIQPDSNDKFSLSITHLEHSIKPGSSGIEESNWIQLIEPLPFDLIFSGISRPSRQHPSDPVALSHRFEYDRYRDNPLDGEWTYLLYFNYQPENSDELYLTMRTNTGLDKFMLPKLEEFELELGAVAYLSEIIDLYRKDEPEKVINELLETDILSLSPKNDLGRQQVFDKVLFIYSAENVAWISDKPQWKIESAKDSEGKIIEGNWIIRNVEDQKLTIFDGVAAVSSTIQVIRNDTFGDNFRLQTEEVELPGFVVPDLDYINVEDTEQNTIRILSGSDVMRRLEKTMDGKTVIECMDYFKNGVKHLLQGREIWSGSVKNAYEVPKFKNNHYYKIIHFIGSNGDFEEVYQVDFIHKDK